MSVSLTGSTQQTTSYVEHIDACLQQHAAVYPVVDDTHTAAVKAIMQYIDYLLATTDFEHYVLDQKRIDDARRLIKNPIFICGPMKSGTTMLGQLLDNHPNLFVMPGDSRYAHYSEKWQTQSFDELARYWSRRWIDPMSLPPFWFFGKSTERYQRFLQYLHFFFYHTTYHRFLCIVMAAVCTNDADISRIDFWVEKTPGNERYVDFLLKQHRDAKFIHMIRDPLTNITSLKKLAYYRMPARTVKKSVREIKRLLHQGLHNQRTLGTHQYYMLSYECLTAKPEYVLHELCQFIGINFNQTLLNPTVNGRPGTANSMYAEKRVHGQVLTQTNEQRYRKELNESELREVVRRLYGEAALLGYVWDADILARYRPILPFDVDYALWSRFIDPAYKILVPQIRPFVRWWRNYSSPVFRGKYET